MVNPNNPPPDSSDQDPTQQDPTPEQLQEFTDTIDKLLSEARYPRHYGEGISTSYTGQSGEPTHVSWGIGSLPWEDIYEIEIHTPLSENDELNVIVIREEYFSYSPGLAKTHYMCLDRGYRDGRRVYSEDETIAFADPIRAFGLSFDDEALAKADDPAARAIKALRERAEQEDYRLTQERIKKALAEMRYLNPNLELRPTWPEERPLAELVEQNRQLLTLLRNDDDPYSRVLDATDINARQLMIKLTEEEIETLAALDPQTTTMSEVKEILDTFNIRREEITPDFGDD